MTKYAIVVITTDEHVSRSAVHHSSRYTFQLFQSNKDVKALADILENAQIDAVAKYSTAKGAYTLAKDAVSQMKAKIDGLETGDMTSISVADFRRIKDDMATELKKLEVARDKAFENFEIASSPDKMDFESIKFPTLAGEFDLNGVPIYSLTRWKLFTWEDFYDFANDKNLNVKRGSF